MNVLYGAPDERDNESQSTHRSRSSEDLGNFMPDFELDQLTYEQRMIQRRGAIRKPCCSVDRRQRNSAALSRESPMFQGAAGINEFPTHADFECRPSQVSERGRQKYQKSSLAFWKSLALDGKNQDNLKPVRKPRKSNGYMERKSLSSDMLTEVSPKSPNKNHCKALIYTINDLSEPVIRNKHPIQWISEESWTEIVNSHKSLSKRQSDLQAAIWELITTEARFLNFLWMVVEIYQPVFHKLQASFVEMECINEFDIFGNILEIYHNNINLWNNCIYLPVEKSRLNHEPLDILLMKQGFLTISSTMDKYVTFMKHQVPMSRNFQRLEKFDSIFKEYVGWTRSYSKFQRDGISAVLSTPFQRITKYKLLLGRIKSFANEDQCGPLDEMIDSVHNFLDYMDSAVPGEKRLEEIQSKLVIENSLLCDINKMGLKGLEQFDLSKSLNGLPERLLIYDGQLKLVTNHKKCEVQCYLFNDMFLICKPIRRDWSKFSILRSPIRIDKFIVKEESESSFMAAVMNDFSFADSVLVFIGEGVEVKLWIDKCTKTRMKYESCKKISNGYPSSFIEPQASDDTVENHLSNGQAFDFSNTKAVTNDPFVSISSDESNDLHDFISISMDTMLLDR